MTREKGALLEGGVGAGIGALWLGVGKAPRLVGQRESARGRGGGRSDSAGAVGTRQLRLTGSPVEALKGHTHEPELTPAIWTPAWCKDECQ